MIVAVVPASIFSSFNSTKEDFVVGFSVVGHKSKIVSFDKVEIKHFFSILCLIDFFGIFSFLVSLDGISASC